MRRSGADDDTGERCNSHQFRRTKTVRIASYLLPSAISGPLPARRIPKDESFSMTLLHDLIGIAETHLDDSADQERLFLKGYEFIKCNRPLNTNRCGVRLFHFPRRKGQKFQHYLKASFVSSILTGKTIFLWLCTEVLVRTSKNLTIS